MNLWEVVSTTSNDRYFMTTSRRLFADGYLGEIAVTVYVEIAQALVDYDYLDETDLEPAVDLLADTLVMDESERDEAILEAEAVADTAVAADDVPIETIYQVEVHDNVMNVAGDAEIMAGGDVIFAVPFVRAANALLDADLIDEINVEAVTSLMAEIWIEEEE